MSKVPFPLHMTPDERRALRVAVAEDDTTMSAFIREAIAEKLARRERTPQSENAEEAAQHQKDSANG